MVEKEPKICVCRNFYIPLRAVMKKTLFIGLFFVLIGASAWADMRVVLKSGASVKGTIVFQNEQVIVLRDADQKAYQFPMSEVVTIEEVVDTVEDVVIEQERAVGALIMVDGGALYDTALPESQWGGRVGASVLVGARDLLDKRIFLGGGIGYSALFMNGENYSLLPILLYTAVPFMSAESKCSPYVGLGVGYGVGLKSHYKGGLHAGIDVGMRMQIGVNKALLLSFRASFQQLGTTWNEMVNETIMTNEVTHSLVGLGLHVGIQL